MISKKAFLRILKLAVLVYAVVGIVLYYFQDKIFYHPVKVSADSTYRFEQPFRELNIPYNRTSTINIIQFQTSSEPKGVVLYFHGNRENIGHYAGYAKNFTEYGYEVWMMDYPGFGKSTGPFTEQMIYNWSLLLYKLARSRYEPSQIIIYGKSLGTGFATQLASIRDCRNLVLETPYYSLPFLLQHYLPVYPSNILKLQVPTYAYMKDVTAPVTIFQGTSDWTVTKGNAEKLKQFLKPTDKVLFIDGGEHNNLPTYQVYQDELRRLLK